MFHKRFAALLASSAVARVGVLSFAVLFLAGCATHHASHDGPSRVAGPAVPPGQVSWIAKVEIEGDGLPSQLAPRHGLPVQDEPTEPWSPNYGSMARAKVKRSAKAPDQATTGGRTIAKVQHVTAMDEEAIIRRAIAEHEMRRRD